MCYRDNVPPLDLESLHVACLSGDNGHGKSALLDAVTWALWGRARARQARTGAISGPSQDELVHQGERDMAVDLDFMARGQRYRVIRRHTLPARGRQGTTILDLFLLGVNGAVAISGSSIRGTEAKIRDLLSMDFKTFINSAFLLQGQADLFTTSAPTERKQRLAEVLDLFYYERIEARAKERARALDAEIKEAAAGIERLERQAAPRSEYEQRLAEVEKALGELTPRVEEQAGEVAELRGTVELLRKRGAEMGDFKRRSEHARTEAADLEKQVEVRRARVAEDEATLGREAEIREGFELLTKTREAVERMDLALTAYNETAQTRAQLEQEIAVQRERVTGRAEALRRRIANDLEPKARAVPELERVLAKLDADRGGVVEAEGHIEADREQVRGQRSRLDYLEGENGRLRGEMEKMRDKFDMLAQDEAECPVCRQPLGAGAQEHLRAEYEERGREDKRLYREHEAEIKALTRRQAELMERAAAAERRLAERRRRLEAGIAGAERDLAEARQAQEALGPAGVELGEVEGDLAEERFAVDERRRLTELDAEAAAVGYDREAHRTAREEAKTAEPWADRHRKLEEARGALPGRREELRSAEEMLARRRKEAAELEGRRRDMEDELKALPSLEGRLERASEDQRGLEERLRSLLVEQGVLGQQLRSALDDEKELADERKRRSTLLREKGIYDQLAVAFGKNGIQALIIESAIPQLQDEANRLLGRLTENRMSLKLQLKEGRRQANLELPSEELEILIADEVGTRSYETFSGGEAFRINFALRIALSRLLSGRSGASLPTLFIDEGFGSQDAAGQDRLREAIQSIQGDFQKIIVITHLESVKEAFPARIEVTKTEAGSTFRVV